MTTGVWLLFTPQTPSSPSSLRVMVWRRMQQMGAVHLQSGVWILPHTAEHEATLRQLLTEIEQQGGSGFLFTAGTLESRFQEEIMARFHAEREQEYQEFRERCQEFLHELEKETQAQKFTFAELEENEQDLQKLTSWLRKIQRRDFFPGTDQQEAVSALSLCRKTLKVFTATVYAHAGFTPQEADVGLVDELPSSSQTIEDDL